MKRAKFAANVHRFRDYVAADLGTGATVYMDPAEAIKFAQALTLCARDCRATVSTESRFSGKSFQFGEG